MRRFTLLVGLLTIGFAAPAWADNITLSPGASINDNTAIGGQGGKGGDGGTGIGIGIGTGGNAHQSQGQAQSQHQGQAQGQGQGQKQQANNSGNHQNVSFEGTSFDRYAPSIAAPALTSAGTGACLGSFSGGLVGPMAGAMFGKTYESQKCENRAGSALLWQYSAKPGPRSEAFERASLRVLSGESLKDALAAEGLLPQAAKTAQVDTTVPDLKLNTPLGEEKKSEGTNFGERASLTVPEALIANLAAQADGAGM